MRSGKRKHKTPVKDYYAVLGVTHSASVGEIRRAFRKLAQDAHPDRNASPDAREKFQELVEAYHALKAPDKRNEFDARIIAEYCASLVGNFEEPGKNKKIPTVEFYRILGKSPVRKSTSH